MMPICIYLYLHHAVFAIHFKEENIGVMSSLTTISVKNAYRLKRTQYRCNIAFGYAQRF